MVFFVVTVCFLNSLGNSEGCAVKLSFARWKGRWSAGH